MASVEQRQETEKMTVNLGKSLEHVAKATGATAHLYKNLELGSWPGQSRIKNQNSFDAMFTDIILKTGVVANLPNATIVTQVHSTAASAQLEESKIATDDTKKAISSNIMTELQAAGLDQVQKQSDGTEITPEYTLQLLNFMSSMALERLERDRKDSIDKRRVAFQAGNWDEHRDVVKTQMIKGESMGQLVMGEVFETLTGIDEFEFEASVDAMNLNPQYTQLIVAAQQGKLPTERSQQEAAGQSPKLQKSEFLNAFSVSGQLTIAALEDQAASQQRAMASGDEAEMMIDMYVDQAKVEDALFVQTGVLQQDLEDAIVYFLGQNDPEAQQAMGSFMQEMNAELARIHAAGGIPRFE